jgi:hypothetical protein
VSINRDLSTHHLRRLCDSLNPGGQSKLARLLGWNYSTVWRKLNGKSRIIHSDEFAIKQALSGLHGLSVISP